MMLTYGFKRLGTEVKQNLFMDSLLQEKIYFP